jgi:hypothetical protein
MASDPRPLTFFVDFARLGLSTYRSWLESLILITALDNVHNLKEGLRWLAILFLKMTLGR